MKFRAEPPPPLAAEGEPPEIRWQFGEGPRKGLPAIEGAGLPAVPYGVAVLVIKPVAHSDRIAVAAHGANLDSVAPHEGAEAPRSGTVRFSGEAIGAKDADDGAGHGGVLRSFDDIIISLFYIYVNRFFIVLHNLNISPSALLFTYP